MFAPVRWVTSSKIILHQRQVACTGKEDSNLCSYSSWQTVVHLAKVSTFAESDFCGCARYLLKSQLGFG